MAAVTYTTVLAMMPVFLVGASGVFLRRELDFDEVGLGLTVAVFMGTSALFAIPAGRVSERIGGQRALALVGLGSASVMLSVAAFARTFTILVFLLALGGLCNSLTQPAANLTIARSAVSHPGLVFGVKQSAVPVATLLAGVSVPLVSLTIGWRWAFAIGAVLAGGGAAVLPRLLSATNGRPVVHRRRIDSATGPLVALALGTGVGTAAAMSVGTFLVGAGVAGGLSPSSAGWLLVGASVAGVVTRLLMGWLADRRGGWALHGVSGLLLVGAAGYSLLMLGGPIRLVLGAFLAFGAGWGWTGLLFYAVVQLNPSAPAAASGIVAAGGAGGAALGPLAFGYVVRETDYGTAWTLAAVAAGVAAGLVSAARVWLRRES